MFPQTRAVYNRQQSRVKTVTIAIPSLHRPDLTSRCIEFIQKQTLPPESWEIVVIENSAQPGKMLLRPASAEHTPHRTARQRGHDRIDQPRRRSH